MKVIAALMLTVTVACAAGCTKPDDPNNPGNEGGGGNGDNGGGGSNETELPAGVYLGVIGFNDELYTKEITRLDASSIAETKDFIGNLTMGGATLLYHSVNTSIDALSSNGIPKDLKSVSIVTFTDGLDKGSYAYSNYNSGAEYLQAVKTRIRTEKVADMDLSAHIVGFQGVDVEAEDEALFLSNLEDLASVPKQNFVHHVTNFDDVQSAFQQILDSLHKETINSKLTLKMPKAEPNTRIRFTFDVEGDLTDPEYADNSSCFIEGTYINDSDRNGVLINVRYVGLSSTSGMTVTSTSEGIYAIFTFEGMKDIDGQPMGQASTQNVKEWDYKESSHKWQHNNEFDSQENTEVKNEHYSALVMLNLDCSRSLGESKFRELKRYAQNFVQKLQQ